MRKRQRKKNNKKLTYWKTWKSPTIENFCRRMKLLALAFKAPKSSPEEREQFLIKLRIQSPIFKPSDIDQMEQRAISGSEAGRQLRKVYARMEASKCEKDK